VSVLRAIRILVCVEWTLLALSIASYLAELPGLPESWRRLALAESEAALPMAAVAAWCAAAAVHLAASAGLWRLAEWARPTYAASALAMLLLGLPLGPTVTPPVSGALAFAAALATGALLAVLYLPSRTSAPLTGSAGPARRLGGLGGVLLAVLAGFALVGVALSVALAAGVWFMLDFGEVLEEGQRAAEGKTDAECVTLALARRESRWLVPESIFLSECLAYAAASEHLCAGAPAEDDDAASAAWVAERCDGPESPPHCKDLMAALQVHCREGG